MRQISRLQNTAVRLRPDLCHGTKNAADLIGLRHFGTPGETRTHYIPLRSTKNRLIHTVLRCYAMFLNPLKYKVFRRIPCFLVSLGFVLFFRLFLRPVSKMLAEQGRETNANELWFVAELTILTL